jgi:hypothetical protein
MRRQSIRSRIIRTMDGRSVDAEGNVLPFPDRACARVEAPVEWAGLRSFLAAVPRLWPPCAEPRDARARRVGITRGGMTHGNGAA